jgi:hypothetical protein
MSPQFKTADTFVAEIRITPSSDKPPLNFPQTYDQEGLVCDVSEIPPPAPPPPAPAKSCTFLSCYWWVILVCALVVAGVVTGVVLGKRKKKV